MLPTGRGISWCHVGLHNRQYIIIITSSEEAVILQRNLTCFTSATVPAYAVSDVTPFPLTHCKSTPDLQPAITMAMLPIQL